MKFTKQDLLTLLIGLFLFSSCKNASTIGIEPDPDFGIKGDLAVVSVNSSTVAEEATSTVSLIRHPLGAITDPIFGKTQADLVMSVMLPSEGYSFGANAIIDSAVLVLPYSTQFYGDTTTSVYNLGVQQLQDDLSSQKTFLNTKEWPVQGGVIGSYNSKIRPKTPFKVTDIVEGKADTMRMAIPQLRIKLDNSFIQNKIMSLDSAILSKNDKFTTAFKGLKIKVINVTNTGGIMFLDFTKNDPIAGANLEVYYKKDDATTSTERDTVFAAFPIHTDPTIGGPVAATIKHDYTGTPVKTQLDVPSPATPYNVTYLQALAGLKNKISFPDLQRFVDEVKAGNAKTRIVINRAELVVNLSNGTDVAPFTASQRLSLYRFDIAGQRANIPDNDMPTETHPGDNRYVGSPEAFGGFYDTAKKRYIFTVTSYLQDLIDGKTEDYGTYIAPSSISEYDIFPSVSSGSRAIISTKSPLTGDQPIKLNIYYTKVN